mgnify:CR=1 FL=1
MTDLSPQAQAVANAFWEDITYIENVDEYNIAAALRAVANQVNHEWDGMECIDHLVAIASELEDISKS